MKKLVIATVFATGSALVTPVAMAVETATGLKQAGVFSTSTLLGAAAGGPVGMFIGALGGAYLGEQIEKADQVKSTEAELAEYKMQVAELRANLESADRKVGELSELALDNLEFQVLFHTGADQLTERGKKRVQALADFLDKHPGLAVRLTGHADPRGTDEYNNVLSQHRALAVQKALEDAGIEQVRIDRKAFGALKSTAPKGDHEAYAMERRVDIEMFNPLLIDTVVQAH